MSRSGRRSKRSSAPGGASRSGTRGSSPTDSEERRGGAASPAPVGRLDAEVLGELEAIAEGAGCELVHGELKGGTLRLFIDREGGVTLAECELVSRQASAFLDLIDFGSGRYLLEVSSPGLDRQLYRPRDYERFTGSRLRVTFRESESGAKRTIRGRLESFRDEGEAFATIVDDEGGERIDVPLELIEVARLELEL